MLKQGGEASNELGLDKTKKRLYEQLSRTYLLPSLKSRASNRQFFAKVLTHKVFTIEKKDVLTFEAKHSDDLPIRAPGFTVLALVKRLDALLKLLNKLPLGFEDTMLPDEKYLLRIARYLDPPNLLEIFITPVKGAKKHGLSADLMYTRF